MRMARCWPSLILLTFTSLTLVNAGPTILLPELTNFIPQCAQECFISFIDSSFPTACGSTPTLDCLCSDDSITGYTIGEGAVECIVSEKGTGLCDGTDASDHVVLSAYTMCSGQNNALPNTHATIVATLVVPNSNPNVVLVPSTAAASTTQTPSTLVTSTQSMSTSEQFTSAVPSTSAPTSLASSSPTSTQTAVQHSQTAAPTATPSSLSKSQVVGITTAAIGGTALMLGLILVFACVKRRQFNRNRDSDEFPFQMDPSKYSQPIKSGRFGLRRPPIVGPGGTSNGIAAKLPKMQAVAPRIPPRLDTLSPNIFSRRSVQADSTIGLAISPESKKIFGQNRTSKLLPPKPALKLQMPPPALARSFSQNAPKPMTFNRTSTATQFEEEDDVAVFNGSQQASNNTRLSYPKQSLQPARLRLSISTPFEIADSSNVAQELSNSSTMPRQSTATQFEEDEVTQNRVRKSNATQFEEDGPDTVTSSKGRKTWARRSTVEELDTAIDMWENFSPINTSGPPAVYFRAADVQPAQPAQYNNRSKFPANQELGYGAGSFSQPRRPNEYPQPKQNQGKLNPYPDTQQVPQLLVPAPQPMNRPITAASSVYSTRSTSLQGSPARTNPATGLLPIVPKVYKKTGPYDAPKNENSMSSFTADGSRISPGGSRTVDLSPVGESPTSGRSPVSYPKIPKPGRLSQSTIRMVSPPPQPIFTIQPHPQSQFRGPEKPWRRAELEAQERRRRSRNVEVNQLIQRQSLQYTPQSPSWDTYTPSPLSPSGPSFSSSNLPFARQRSQSQNQNQNQQYKATTSPLFHIPEEPLTFSKSHLALASRRRGSQAALSLHLNPTNPNPILNSNTNSEPQRKWRVLKEEERDAAKSSAWRPALATQTQTLHVMEREIAELPGTPGWAQAPRLTPTRRGEDLFLSVGR